MSRFNIAKGFVTTVLLLAAVIVPLSTALAFDGRLVITEEIFNIIAGEIEKYLVYTGHFGVWKLSCDYTLRVKDLTFDIKPHPQRVEITGDVDGDCGSFPITGNIKTKGDIYYDSGQNAIVLSVDPTSYTPCFPGGCLPFSIDIGQALTPGLIIPATGRLSLNTATGSTNLRLSPRNINLRKSETDIKIEGDVIIW